MNVICFFFSEDSFEGVTQHLLYLHGVVEVMSQTFTLWVLIQVKQRPLGCSVRK